MLFKGEYLMKKTKKAKIGFWIIFIILALVLYLQNTGFFMHTDKLSLDLFVFDFNTSPLPMIVFIAGFFFIGLIIAFFFGLIERFRAKKVIHGLTLKLEEQNKMLTTQKNEVDRLRKVLQEGVEINSDFKETSANESISQSERFEK
jgi:uncharacterized integral membrane protein